MIALPNLRSRGPARPHLRSPARKQVPSLRAGSDTRGRPAPRVLTTSSEDRGRQALQGNAPGQVQGHQAVEASKTATHVHGGIEQTPVRLQAYYPKPMGWPASMSRWRTQ